MSDDSQEILLTEYKANVDLWKHDDDLRQKRTTTFLTFNVLLYGVTAFAIKEVNIVGEWTAVASVGAASLGILTCVFWIFVHLRNDQYAAFRRFQLIEIECKLKVADTFTKQYSAISRGEKITFPHSKNSFSVPRIVKMSSSKLEYALPFATLLT